MIENRRAPLKGETLNVKLDAVKDRRHIMLAWGMKDDSDSPRLTPMQQTKNYVEWTVRAAVKGIERYDTTSYCMPRCRTGIKGGSPCAIISPLGICIVAQNAVNRMLQQLPSRACS